MGLETTQGKSPPHRTNALPIVISKQKIKEVASKIASNKAQTPASDPYTDLHADVGGDKGKKVDTPFIDRLSVVLNVPEGNGEAIHGNLMTQVKDIASILRSMSCRGGTREN